MVSGGRSGKMVEHGPRIQLSAPRKKAESLREGKAAVGENSSERSEVEC